MPHFETGKYAFYIWTAYAISAAVFVLMVASSLAHARHWKARLDALTRK
jgi:heme exporter protein D